MYVKLAVYISPAFRLCMCSVNLPVQHCQQYFLSDSAGRQALNESYIAGID